MNTARTRRRPQPRATAADSTPQAATKKKATWGTTPAPSHPRTPEPEPPPPSAAIVAQRRRRSPARDAWRMPAPARETLAPRRAPVDLVLLAVGDPEDLDLVAPTHDPDLRDEPVVDVTGMSPEQIVAFVLEQLGFVDLDEVLALTTTPAPVVDAPDSWQDRFRALRQELQTRTRSRDARLDDDALAAFPREDAVNDWTLERLPRAA